MSDLGHKFLAAALGQDGAKALRKAVEREPALAEILIPRAIIGWLDFTTEHEYEGPIPGVENSYVQFQKSEDGFAGTISLEEGVYSFEKSSVYHLAASIATALGLKPSTVDPQIRDVVLVKLGKSIDTLAKAQVLMQELRSPKALKVTRMTTHGAYHIEHSGAGDRPYSVVHTATNSPVQTGIASLRDAQPIADWHHNRYGGKFLASISKKVLDPNAGYQLHDSHHDIGDGNFVTNVAAHKNGVEVARATLAHVNNQLKPVMIYVAPEHRRQGIASALYAHAQKTTNKTVMPSEIQTPAGEALWSGNSKSPQFGPGSTPQKLAASAVEKTELPGKTHQPTPQQGPQAPTPPMKQPSNAVAKPNKQPKLPSLAIGKSEADQACKMCGGRQFENNKFKGCICFRELSKSITTTAYGDGFVLDFTSGTDPEVVRSLMRALKWKK